MSYDPYAPSSSTATSSGLNANVNDDGLGQSMEWSANVEMANGGSDQNVSGGGRSKRSRDHADNEQGAAPSRSPKKRRGTPVVPTRSSPRLREQRERKRRQQLPQRQQQQQQQYQLEREQQQHVEQVQQQQRQQRHQQRVLRQQQREQQQHEQQLQLELQRQQQLQQEQQEQQQLQQLQQEQQEQQQQQQLQQEQQEQQELQQQQQEQQEQQQFQQEQQEQQQQHQLQEEQEQLEQQAQAEAQARRHAINIAENEAIIQAQETELFLPYQQGEEWLRLFNVAQQVRIEEHAHLDLEQLEFVEQRITDELVSRQRMREDLRDHRQREQLQGLGEDTFVATLLNHVEVTLPLLESEIERVQTRIDESRYLSLTNFTDIDPQSARVDGGCSICVSEFLPDQLVCILRCGHTFHGECVHEWYNSAAPSSRTCPNCRTPMFPERGQDT